MKSIGVDSFELPSSDFEVKGPVNLQAGRICHPIHLIFLSPWKKAATEDWFSRAERYPLKFASEVLVMASASAQFTATPASALDAAIWS